MGEYCRQPRNTQPDDCNEPRLRRQRRHTSDTSDTAAQETHPTTARVQELKVYATRRGREHPCVTNAALVAAGAPRKGKGPEHQGAAPPRSAAEVSPCAQRSRQGRPLRQLPAARRGTPKAAALAAAAGWARRLRREATRRARAARRADGQCAEGDEGRGGPDRSKRVWLSAPALPPAQSTASPLSHHRYASHGPSDDRLRILERAALRAL